MKLFSWAQRKFHPHPSLDKNQVRAAGTLHEINPPNLPYNELDVQARASRDTHAEVLTIGTMGMGSLLRTSCNNEGEEEEEEEEEEEDQEVEERHKILAHSVSLNAEPSSPNRESVSSNRESVSSVDIQKLQEELQKILYFKLGQASKSDNPKSSTTATEKAKKKKSNRSSCYNNILNEQNAGGGAIRPPSNVRGAFPLHNFLEMPMETMESCTSATGDNKVLNKKQYLLLLQSLKSKLLHYTFPTRVKIPPFLFEKLVKPKVTRDLPNDTKMDKMLHLLRKVMDKRPNGRWRKGQKEGNNDKAKHTFTNQEEEEEQLKWAVARSCRGSERFINYITSTLAHVDKENSCTVHGQQHLHHYQHRSEEDGQLQLMLSTSPSLSNECWIKTDDEYLVLEL